MITISFFYKNHRGVIEERTIDVDGVEYHGNPGMGYQPGWFISGHCHDRDARRSFALVNIQLPDGVVGEKHNAVFKLLPVK